MQTHTHTMRMPVNPQLMTKVLTMHRNVFYALKELINNSLYAGAKKISIHLIPTECDQDSPMYRPIEKIVVEDNGRGVPFPQFEKSIMEIATDNKPEGKGVGRFAALQIGRKMTISTVGFDKVSKTKALTTVSFSVNDFKGKNISEKPFTIYTEETTDEPGYTVVIEDLYTYDPDCKLRNKLGNDFKDITLFKQKLFKAYPIEIFRGKVVFDINGQELKREDFFIDTPRKKTLTYTDSFGKDYDLILNIYSVRLSPPKTQVFFLERSTTTPLAEYTYNSPWYDPISMGSLFILVQSDVITDELYANSEMEDIGGSQWKDLTTAVRDGIDEYFKTDYKKIASFVSRLHTDDYYPYDGSEKSVRKDIFDRTAFLFEEEYKLQTKDDSTRNLIYTLMRQVIENGDTRFLMGHLNALTKNSRESLIELLDETKLDSVIRFSSSIAKKKRAVTTINKLIYSEDAMINERKALVSYVANNLWIFGRQYANSSPLQLTQDHYPLIESLHNEFFNYKEKDNNLRRDLAKGVSSLENGFVYGEYPLGGDQTEILYVEVLSPAFMVSSKETNALNDLGYKIRTDGKYPKDHYSYKVILMTPGFDDVQNTYWPDIKAKGYVYQSIPEYNIQLYIIMWSEFLDDILRGLNYMSRSLELKEKDVSLVLEKDYNELIQLPKKQMYKKKSTNFQTDKD